MIGISALRTIPIVPYMLGGFRDRGGLQIQTSQNTGNKYNSSNVTRNKERARRLAQIEKAKQKQLAKNDKLPS